MHPPACEACLFGEISKLNLALGCSKMFGLLLTFDFCNGNDCTDIFVVFCICVSEDVNGSSFLRKKRVVLGSTYLGWKVSTSVGVGQASRSIVPPAPSNHRA